ncbi:MAG: hypothetical protein ACJASY_000828 [Halioglobus sp.]|jgi:hypothetical protein
MISMPDLVSDGLALFFAWLFALAAIHKLRAAGDYLAPMSAYLPGMNLTTVSVRVVAGVELSVAVMVLLPGSRTIGLIASAGVLVVYAAAMALQISRGIDNIKCGCAGPSSQVLVSPALVLRNIVCSALALLALTPTTGVTSGIAGLGLTLFVPAFMMMVYLCSEQLIGNAQQMVGEH